MSPKILVLQCQVSDVSKSWDVFISAYNDSERVRLTFHNVCSAEKFWVVLPEYQYRNDEVPAGSIFIDSSMCSESEVISDAFRKIAVSASDGRRICVDITGFTRPQIMFMVLYFRHLGISKYEMLYTEPLYYRAGDMTKFTDGEVVVRLVDGYHGVSNPDSTRDFLLIGIGFDSGVMGQVVAEKEATPIHLHSLPSLSPDMYQNSVLCWDRLSLDPIAEDQTYFSPANDPYAVADTLSDIYSWVERGGAPTNIYLCPLSTKPQALGFAIFLRDRAADGVLKVISPYPAKYSRQDSSGVGRTWLYRVGE